MFYDGPTWRRLILDVAIFACPSRRAQGIFYRPVPLPWGAGRASWAPHRARNGQRPRPPLSNAQPPPGAGWSGPRNGRDLPSARARRPVTALEPPRTLPRRPAWRGLGHLEVLKAIFLGGARNLLRPPKAALARCGRPTADRLGTACRPCLFSICGRFRRPGRWACTRLVGRPAPAVAVLFWGPRVRAVAGGPPFGCLDDPLNALGVRPAAAGVSGPPVTAKAFGPPAACDCRDPTPISGSVRRGPGAAGHERL